MESLDAFVFECSFVKLLVRIRKFFSCFWTLVHQVFKWYSWYCKKTSNLPMPYLSVYMAQVA